MVRRGWLSNERPSMRSLGAAHLVTAECNCDVRCARSALSFAFSAEVSSDGPPGQVQGAG